MGTIVIIMVLAGVGSLVAAWSFCEPKSETYNFLMMVAGVCLNGLALLVVGGFVLVSVALIAANF